MTEHLPTLELEIESLLERLRPAPSRAHVEQTLTTGYAHALRLEGERLRAESRLRSLIRSGSAKLVELTEARVALEDASAELRRLRSLLADLRAHALH